MKGRIGNILTAVILFLFPLVLLLLAEFHWDYRPNVILFPWMAGSLIMLSALWLLIRSFIAPVENLVQEGEIIADGDDPRSSVLKRMLWMASVYPLCYSLGLIIGLILFTLAYTSYHRLPWWQRLLSALIVFVVVYIGFYTLLGVALPISPVWMRG